MVINMKQTNEKNKALALELLKMKEEAKNKTVNENICIQSQLKYNKSKRREN